MLFGVMGGESLTINGNKTQQRCVTPRKTAAKETSVLKYHHNKSLPFQLPFNKSNQYTTAFEYVLSIFQ